MGQITSSVGLISGIDTAAIIEQLINIESRPKTQIQQRNAVLEAQQTAYQTVNAQLLALKGNASRISSQDAFEATTASSSDESVATVSSGTGAAVGNYEITVKQLVGSQQTVSRGFVDADASFLAPDGATLTFNRGEARLDRTTLLSELNGGQGIERGYVRVTDRSGATAVVDLTSVVSVDDVVDQFNRATGVNVIAEIDGDAIRLTDATGQSRSDLIIQDVGSSGEGTATSLGLAGRSSSGTLTGSNVNTVGTATYLSSLNDGNGLRTVAGEADLALTLADGSNFEINLSNAVTLEDLLDTIESATDGNVSAQINGDGISLRLTDNTAGPGTFEVSALNDSQAALDLGILRTDTNGNGVITGTRINSQINATSLNNLIGGKGLTAFGGQPFVTLTGDIELADLLQGAGITTTGDTGADLEILPRDADETTTPVGIDLDALTTVQDLIDAVDTATGGKVSLALDGQTLVATDNTDADGPLVIRNANGTSAAADLGLNIEAAVDSVTSLDLDPTGPLLDDTRITVTNSAGAVRDIDLAGSRSVQDIIEKINDAGAGIRAQLNPAGTGLSLVDTAGGTGDLLIEDPTGGALAAQLQIAGSHETGRIDSGPLGFQYLNEGTRLDNLGVTRGRFTITDSDGQTATVDLTQGNEQTIADVIGEINSRGLAINARVNDTGDGLILEDTGSGSVGITVTEDGSTTAADLGILGSFEPGEAVDGSFRRTIDVTPTDTLASLARKINDAKLGVTAAVINDGSPGAPFRLSLTSENPGTGGAFTFDDGGIGLDVNDLSRARDAVVFFGGEDPADSLLVTSKSNTLETLIPGATVSLLTTSDGPVQITVGDDREAITSAASDFVKSFNDLFQTINEFDSYNAETEERGLLLGDSALARLRTAIYNAVIGGNAGLTGQFNSLAQIGISIGSGARLQIDQNKFAEALAADPDGVRDLFTLQQFAVDPETGEETDEILAQGVGAEIDALLERLTDGTDGVIERQVEILSDQIRANQRRIDQVDDTIEDKRSRLEREFANLESTLAGLSDQQSALAGLSQAQAQV